MKVVKVMAFREVYKLFVDAWMLYRKYSARKVTDSLKINTFRWYLALSESLYVESMWHQWQHLPQHKISCRQSLQQLHREY